MTMADTIAVMNAGVIEQMGSPADLYEHPRTTFVANFLGQSNLIEGKVLQKSGDEFTTEVQGQRVLASNVTSAHLDDKVWIGVRPEKIRLQRTGAEPGNAISVNRLPGGRITDVSFVGVSTQYLVAMPWGQELMVFEQNSGEGERFAQGDEADLTWSPEFTFLLDSAQDAFAGAEEE